VEAVVATTVEAEAALAALFSKLSVLKEALLTP